MRQRKVRVVGNCQASAIATFYAHFFGRRAGEDVAYVDDLGHDAASLQREVEDADLLIVQARDFKHGLSREELGAGAEIHTFPMVVAGFLWPFANEPHPLNQAERPISDGPYPSQMGDSFLNRLIAKGVGPEQALDRYLALDIGKTAHLDRMAELFLDRQRERDAATGFEIAGEIERGFRTEKMFLTGEHPDARIFGVVAEQLFRHMDLPSAHIDQALASLFRSPFPATELPLHPGVIAHFGLTFADADTSYQYMHERKQTFADYVLRYMRFDNNPLLRRALFEADRQDPAATLALLDEALLHSPASARGHQVRGVLLERLGRPEEAVEAYHRAVSQEPTDPDLHISLAGGLRRNGRLEEATQVARAAIAVAPVHAPSHIALAEVEGDRKDMPAMAAAAAEAIRLDPGNGHSFRMLGIGLAATGQVAEAEPYARQGMLAEPQVADHVNLVAELVEGQGRRSDAIDLLEEKWTAGVFNDQTFSLMGNFWLREGRLDRAEAVFREGADRYGESRRDIVECLAQVRGMLQEPPH